MFRALTEGSPLVPVPGVREGVDVLAAGPWTDRLAEDLARRIHADGPAGLGPARDALVAVGEGYDLVVVDTPPSADVLLDLGLAGSRFVCCPVRFDQGSVDGLARVDARRRVLADSDVNVDLELLGVVLFGFGVAERRMLRDTRAQIDYLLDGVAPVFPTFIREARKAARHMRAHGVVASEYFLASQEAAPWFEAPPGEESFARNAAGLATDYWEVTREILSRLSERVTARDAHPGELLSAEPAGAGEARVAPPTPAPASVVDLGSYRGRTGAARAVVPPPRVSATDGGSGQGVTAGPRSAPPAAPGPEGGQAGREGRRALSAGVTRGACAGGGSPTGPAAPARRASRSRGPGTWPGPPWRTWP